MLAVNMLPHKWHYTKTKSKVISTHLKMWFLPSLSQSGVKVFSTSNSVSCFLHGTIMQYPHHSDINRIKCAGLLLLLSELHSLALNGFLFCFCFFSQSTTHQKSLCVSSRSNKPSFLIKPGSFLCFFLHLHHLYINGIMWSHCEECVSHHHMHENKQNGELNAKHCSIVQQ